MVTIQLPGNVKASIAEGVWSSETPRVAELLNLLFVIEDSPSIPDRDWESAMLAVKFAGARLLEGQPRLGAEQDALQ